MEHAVTQVVSDKDRRTEIDLAVWMDLPPERLYSFLLKLAGIVMQRHMLEERAENN